MAAGPTRFLRHSHHYRYRTVGKEWSKLSPVGNFVEQRHSPLVGRLGTAGRPRLAVLEKRDARICFATLLRTALNGYFFARCLFKERSARKSGGVAKFFFDTQKLIVFCDAIGAACRPSFDWSRGGGHRQVGDEGIFRFTGAMRNDGVIAGFAGQLDGIDG